MLRSSSSGPQCRLIFSLFPAGLYELCSSAYLLTGCVLREVGHGRTKHFLHWSVSFSDPCDSRSLLRALLSSQGAAG
jgi:hypothetical protein